MIHKDNLKEVLEILGFKHKGQKYKKTYQNSDKVFIELDFSSQAITYAPIDESFKDGEYPSSSKPSCGFIIHRHTTTNFSEPENFVCLVAIDKLLSKGYKPEHIILEPSFKVGHNQQVYGDILILKQNYDPLILIENKTAGSKFSNEWGRMQKDGGQLFSYYAVNRADFLCLLSFDYDASIKDNKDKISYKSYIITMLDNEEHLEKINANLKDEDKKIRFDSPENANSRAYFRVWTDSYQQSKTEKGLLEEDILSYKIGKEKYSTKDLKAVSYNEISSIYHEFATILRNNAIGNYENTFYVLVDLFLCKITDEKYNEKNLQFYYKGTMYDNPFSYIDRLLNLYEKGVQDLFKKNIVNVKKEEIDELFSTAKRHKGKFKADLDKLFDKQRYFQIKKFNFIDIENEEEFFLNFKVLTKIASLIQDFYISKSDNNQFLGDLFEGFLNRSVHQTEGRFFTPTPITNFIIHSLPSLNKNAKVLDFACGAGHFLTEFIAHQKDAKLYGIEKNKDLSKVAQIACKIHDYNRKSNIIFQDSLDFIKESHKDDFKDSSFDLILSNPPYSVKGFFSTLQEAVRKKYELEKEIDTKSYDKNNAIECFFIERAKQLLKPNGLIALILPVSILQKGVVYEKTREILFKHFQILALVELNKRTFGSTGTQTIIIFAKRVEKYGFDLLDKLKESNYNDEALKNEFLQDNFLKIYCEFMAYDYDEFKAFMSEGILSENLKNTGSFKGYFDDFNANKPKRFKKERLKLSEQETLFKASRFFDKSKELKAQKQDFLNFLKSQDYKEAEYNLFYERFLNDIKDLESQKMLYFSLIQDNELILIKSPQDKSKDNKSNKANIIKFLGYDWSNRKGDEGIKYQTSKNEDKDLQESDDDSDEEKKEKEVLRNINSIKFISTPLYNPNDKNDPTKLNTAIKAFIESSFCDDSFCHSEQSEESQALNCHSERSEESQKDNNRDISAFSKPQYDNPLRHSEALAEVSQDSTNNNAFVIASETKQSTNQTDLAKNANGLPQRQFAMTKATNYEDNKSQILNLIHSLNPNDPDSYQIALVDLKNMINFSNAEFNKAISLNPKKQRRKILSSFEIVKLETCGQFIMGGTPSRKSSQYWNGTIKWLTISDYSNCQIITDTKEKITELGFTESNAKIVPKGAVVVSIYATIGRVGILGEDMTTNQAIVSIIPNSDFINKYLMYVIDFYKFQLFDEAITTSQSNINLSILQNMLIPKPPLPTQKQIVAECEKVEEQYKTIRMTIEEYQNLIRAILVKCGICEEANIENTSRGGALTSLENIDEILIIILKNLENLQSKIDFEFLESLNPSRHCTPFSHSERSEESQSPFRHSEALAEESQNLVMLSESETSQQDSHNKDISLTKLAQYDNLSHSEQSEESQDDDLNALLASLPTPPKEGWEKVRLSSLLENTGGNNIKIPKNEFLPSGKYPIISQENDNLINGWTNLENPINNIPIIVFGDHSCSFKYVDFPFFRGADGTQILKIKPQNNTKFIFYSLREVKIYNQEKYERHFKYLKQIQIPLPALPEQEKIISVIEKIESKIAKIDAKIATLESQKQEILNNALIIGGGGKKP